MDKKCGIVCLVTSVALASSFVGCASFTSKIWISSVNGAQNPGSLSSASVTGTNSNFLPSGSILLSRLMPTVKNNSFTKLASRSSSGKVMAPLMGYIPPAKEFLAAKSEVWIELSRKTGELTVFRGNKEIVKAIKSTGAVTLNTGNYTLQKKQKNPLWYAPDNYFNNRKLSVPPQNDSLRYRKGALGNYVIYPTAEFPIHSGLVWNKEVGGLSISDKELAAIYGLLPVGSKIIVK